MYFTLKKKCMTANVRSFFFVCKCWLTIDVLPSTTWITTELFSLRKVVSGEDFCSVHGPSQPRNGGEDEVSLLLVCLPGHKRRQVRNLRSQPFGFLWTWLHLNVYIPPRRHMHLSLMNALISRALNEMWKCQNMLRGLVKELLDLHKLPVVRLLLTNWPPCLPFHIPYQHTPLIFSSFSLFSVSLRPITQLCLGSWWVLPVSMEFNIPFSFMYVGFFLLKIMFPAYRELARCWESSGLHEKI